MFKKILIANRGEIAVRVISACKKLGITAVTVHSQADADAPHALEADETFLIGPPPVAQSYLNMEEIIRVASRCGAEAVHPGYGLLSENPEFASACERAGLVFIGPPAASIAKMGIKTGARRIMLESGIPVVPGSGPLESPAEAEKAAREIGYPVMVKASAGGGGIGMQLVEGPDAMEKSFTTCRARAQAAFANPQIYLEKYISAPRHIEVQVFADKHHNFVHLGERECSIQRRHQKIIEEAPSTVSTPELRKAMGEAAVRAAKAVGYNSVGTMEFLVDKNNNFYFMEMNTRVQVEHPVTEMVTGVDVVREQIRSAAGLKLRYKQTDIKIHGHAIECRINAEDPVKFTPSPGKIVGYHPPGGLGVRVDSFVYDQYTVLPHYDSLIAKLIVHADNRQDAIKRMARALDEYIIEGIKTTIPFHKRIMANKDFIEGNIDTSFLERIVLE